MRRFAARVVLRHMPTKKLCIYVEIFDIEWPRSTDLAMVLGSLCDQGKKPFGWGAPRAPQRAPKTNPPTSSAESFGCFAKRAQNGMLVQLVRRPVSFTAYVLFEISQSS